MGQWFSECEWVSKTVNERRESVGGGVEGVTLTVHEWMRALVRREDIDSK